MIYNDKNITYSDFSLFLVESVMQINLYLRNNTIYTGKINAIQKLS